MRYGFHCGECGLDIEQSLKIGTAPESVECPECGEQAKRVFSCNFELAGGGWPSKGLSLDREMTAKNERAGKRMRKEHTPGMKLAALDYGNGDIREVKPS
jgi:putative FmdB family regulatory protein